MFLQITRLLGVEFSYAHVAYTRLCQVDVDTRGGFVTGVKMSHIHPISGSAEKFSFITATHVSMRSTCSRVREKESRVIIPRNQQVASSVTEAGVEVW